MTTAEKEFIDRLRITRELTKKEYNDLLKYEDKYGELSTSEIANKFN